MTLDDLNTYNSENELLAIDKSTRTRWTDTDS